VALSPDGKIALTVCGQEARVWEAATGRLLCGPLVHLAPIAAVAFSRDGRTVLTGGADYSARLWDIGTGGAIGEPLRHARHVRTVAFSPDGRTVVTISMSPGGGVNGYLLRFWDVATGKPLGPSLPQGEANSLAFTADGSEALVGRWWGVQRWVPPTPLRGPASRLVLWAQLVTPKELDAAGVAGWQTAENWQERHRRLLTSGGPIVPRQDVLAWHRREAATCEQHGPWLSALWHLDRLIAAEPASWAHYLARGRGRAALLQPEDALADFAQAIALGARDVPASIQKAVALREQGQLEAALAELRKAIKSQLATAPTHNYWGLVFRGQGKPAEAIAEFRKALAANPDYGPALWNLSALLANGADPNLRDPRRAIDLAKRGIALKGTRNDNGAGWWQTLGWAHYRIGAWKESIAALEKSIELYKPGADADQWLFLAMAHWQLGHKEEARRWYDRAAEWIEKNQEAIDRGQRNRLVDDVRNYRAEAAALLGLQEKK
jgi:tetratricopeptide (TPR) repeat protein